MVAAVGVPTSHDLVFLWFAVGMASVRVTDLRRRVPRLVIDWAPFVVAAVLWTWFHDRFAGFATMVCVLALTGFATYALYPAVPPWLAARHGNVGEANRLIGIVWQHVPIAHYGSLFEKGQSYANNVAAMPSLHAAYALLITLYLWRLVPRWAHVPLALYPLAMAFALIYSGEHYLVDCIAG